MHIWSSLNVLRSNALVSLDTPNETLVAANHYNIRDMLGGRMLQVSAILETIFSLDYQYCPKSKSAFLTECHLILIKFTLP